MLNYWFVLGREPLLSAAEIAAIFKSTNYQIEPPLLKISIPELNTEATAVLMKRLGGTIKIGVEMAESLSESELLDAIATELHTVEGKIHFGISLYEKVEPGAKSRSRGEQLIDTVYQWGKEIKRRLKEAELSVRHVYNREAILSSVTVEKNGLTKRGREFLICQDDGGDGRGRKFSAPTPSVTYSLAKTLAVQPFEAFGARDFGRPGRDDLSGMLPPKLALMMLNIATKSPGVGTDCNPSLLLDPFCGSGTILTEAMLLGYTKLIGSDVSEKAIEDSRKNVEWVQGNWKLETRNWGSELFQSDIKNISQKITPASIDSIVTEPYLGKPLKGNELPEQLMAQKDELKKLYLESFQQFFTILKPGGRVVFVIPRFRTNHFAPSPARRAPSNDWGGEVRGGGSNNGWLIIDCVEEIKKLGFLVVPLLPQHDFLLYARSDQRVGREIWRFEKRK